MLVCQAVTDTTVILLPGEGTRMEDASVTVSTEGDVATVTLNRPAARNALSKGTAETLTAQFESLVESDARCVVLEGAGPAFCAGGDIDAMLEGVTGDQPPAKRVELVVSALHEAIRTVHSCPLPVVAKIDGPAFGAGAGLALACDLQVASTDGQIGFGFRRVGLASDSGVSYFLPRIVGPNKAKELLFTGELLDARSAAELGLFTRVFDAETFESEVSALVADIASGPTVALGHAKRLVNRSLDSSLEQALENEATAQGVAFTTEDHEEGATAFVEKRDPEFQGR
ncbi:enoyl-CoA hydratase-related protein [Haloarcula sp. 1CSR25-25]|uniref:enoyl-CoA hydratase/isomerase family protein n=1 Tax=Haloarcula sp. 1CSR25-25 TaxID=2862545 RepID=UPI00289441C7|nr:enoyl-CoA hydratase-related protein [Haloarcula sp. 1CSR25-25]MDT3435287.1 enoyl-CoA hydratase/isomerase family protein [Haloarcula sp. 1CSR25-25]